MSRESRLRDAIFAAQRNGTFWDDASDSHSHLMSAHVGLSDDDLMGRILSGQTTAASSFSNIGDARGVLEDAIGGNVGGILAAMDGVDDYRTFSMSVEMPDDLYHDPDCPVDFETWQHGVMLDRDGHLSERMTNAVTIVCFKNPSTAYGFTVKTAYPDITAPSAWETGHDLAPLLRRNRLYGMFGPERRAFWEHAVRPGRTPAHWQPGDGRVPMCVVLDAPSGTDGLTDRVFVSCESTTTSRYDDATHRKVASPYGFLIGRESARTVSLDDRDVAAAFAADHPSMMREILEIERDMSSDATSRQRPTRQLADCDDMPGDDCWPMPET